MNVLFVAGRLNDNQLGRVHSLWLIAREGGHEARVASISREPVWEPLRQDAAFATSCHVTDRHGLRELAQTWAEVVIAVKPLPDSFGEALALCKAVPLPLVVDVDDPDLEVYLSEASTARLAARTIRHPRLVYKLRRMRRLARLYPSFASNPVLQARYGGSIIPHARPDFGYGTAHTQRSPTVAFVGTPRPHKGIDLLRAAVAELAHEGYRLVITGDRPEGEARPWEDWVGTTSSQEGMALLRQCDIVALPSLRSTTAQGQLPMKLIDAMLAGRAVAVSDIEPMPWALDGTGVVFSAGSVASLVAGLRGYQDPDTRTRVGLAARAVALERYTPAALAPRFGDVLDEATQLAARQTA